MVLIPHHLPINGTWPNLLRRLSRTVLEAHKQHKLMSPLGSSKSKTKTVMTTIVMKPTTLPTNGAGTSTAAPIGTVMVSASIEETKTAIAALLSLGSDLPQPDNDATAENSALVPINPTTTDNSTPSTSTLTGINASKKKQKKPTQHKQSQSIKRFVTVEYKLKCKCRCAHKFRCGKCDQSF